MNKRFLVLCLLTATAAYAEEDAAPEPPSNLFFDTDVYVYEPKFTLSYGMRSLSGAKSAFSGTAKITDASQRIAGVTGTGEDRIYHDGAVRVDPRGVSVDDGNGGSVNVPITPDGKTNSWGFGEAKQILPDGTIAMHAYTANIIDAGPRSKNPSSTYGAEVALKREMGKIAARFVWNLDAGLSLNDIHSKMSDKERATITTVTDAYSLGGAPAPLPPYNSPSTTSVAVIDAAGNAVTNADGSAQTVNVDSSTLLGNEPETRTTTVAVDNTSVTNRYHLRGAYFTFRAGPSIIVPLTAGLRATFSAGAVLVYAGTTYSVEQDFVPDTGQEIISTVSDTENRLLPGFYADASMEFWLSPRTGFYLGAVYQNSGSFTQSIISNGSPGLPNTANYATKVDLSNLEGFRFGVNYRF